MRYLVLVTDYDNTLASHGRVADATRAALVRLRASGRRAILVTGRRVDDLLRVCSCIELFDYVVAENGAVVYDPQTREAMRLAGPPPERFIAELRQRGVQPIEVGEVIVATHAPQEAKVLETIRELGLELQVIFNRHAVMVLPPGINKASGTKLALRNLGMSPHEAVAVGDAENDHSFMQVAECAEQETRRFPIELRPSAISRALVRLVVRLRREAWRTRVVGQRVDGRARGGRAVEHLAHASRELALARLEIQCSEARQSGGGLRTDQGAETEEHVEPTAADLRRLLRRGRRIGPAGDIHQRYGIAVATIEGQRLQRIGVQREEPTVEVRVE